MAIDFSNNGATDWYEVAGAITLPDADWAILFWVHLTTALTGAGFRYYVSNKALNQPDSINLYLDEATAQARMRIRDGADVNADINGPVLSGTGSFLVVAQRRSGTKSIYVCPKDGTASVVNNATVIGAVSSANLWNKGRRRDGDVDRYSKDIFGETGVILNASFTQAQIEDIATGKPFQAFGGFEAIWPSHTPDDLRDITGNGHTLTKNGAALYSGIAFLEKRWQRHAAGSN